jgi:DNA helicase HerA-like ATPase
VILDVSQLSNVQADLVALTVARRLFEHRLDLGVEESSRRPVISIVSEEAPLYLSPERVESPFNPFARIAREGRKFGVGLVAISQMATLIERQLLANFNTLIVMRTRSSSDLNFFRDIGIPVETLPYLGDREAFLYTPDLPIKEPIPVYIQSWFDDEVIKQVRERVKRLSREVKVPKEMLED